MVKGDKAGSIEKDKYVAFMLQARWRLPWIPNS